MKQDTNQTTILNDEQAINAIYDLLGNAFPDKNIQHEPLAIQPVGNFGIINPGTKNIYNALQKLDRKTRSKSDAENNIPMAEIINRDYNNHESDLFDTLTDWSRFAIIIPNYKIAPAIVGAFLGEFGGEPSYHEKENYQAVHLHTSYKDVNLEFQFHTVQHAELKKATDIFYHEYNNIIVPKNSRIEQEKNAVENKMSEYCQMVYSRSDFTENLPAIKAIIEDYQQRGAKIPQQKLTHFLEYISKAEMVQKELSDYLPQFLTRLNVLLDEQNLNATQENIEQKSNI